MYTEHDLLLIVAILALCLYWITRGRDKQIGEGQVPDFKLDQQSTELASIEARPPVPPANLSERLKSSRRGLFDKISTVFSAKSLLDKASLEELEALLVSSDLGINTVGKLLTSLKESIQKGEEITREILINKLKVFLLQILAAEKAVEQTTNGAKVIMLVGVNGVGKTTTAAKLAQKYKEEGKRVMLVAADTFRAAAVDQLKEWGARINVPVISGADNSKPATVVYDGMVAAKNDCDVLIIDTAGRLHNKGNLMQELAGVRNSIERHQVDAPHEVLLVLDGTTGQNALSQAKEFNQATKLTGIVVTKLDGTAKGGIVVAIKEQLNIPVRYIGVGESYHDLREFEAEAFVDALLDLTEDINQTTTSAHAVTRRRRRESSTGL